MLIKASEIIDKNVVYSVTGKKIGKINNIIICLQKKIIIGLICEVPEFLRKEKLFIEISDIKHVKYQNIVIKNKIKKTEKIIGDKFTSQKGKRIISEEGKDLGILEDIIFEMSDGKIKVFEISRGLLSDLIYRRKKLPVEKFKVFGKDFIIFEV